MVAGYRMRGRLVARYYWEAQAATYNDMIRQRESLSYIGRMMRGCSELLGHESSSRLHIPSVHLSFVRTAYNRGDRSTSSLIQQDTIRLPLATKKAGVVAALTLSLLDVRTFTLHCDTFRLSSQSLSQDGTSR